MANIPQPHWKELFYSKSKINNAGRMMRDENLSSDEYENAVKIIDNWRAAHAYPMHVIYMHLRRMAQPQDYIVAERLKRLDSIVAKLKRQPTMALWKMQDLGGCRFIVPTIDKVYSFSSAYRASKKRHIYKAELCKDYIKFPKEDGYRGIHEVYEFYSDKKEELNGKFLIEIQFRTQLQHLWATAVETMGLFTNQAIKSGQGTSDIRRFFALVSSLFAIEEGCPVVPNTPTDIQDIIKELRELNKINNFLPMLRAIQTVVSNEDAITQGKKFNQNGYYLLLLNYGQRRLQIIYFKPSKIDEANKIYAEIEKNKNKNNLNIDAVLVNISSFKTLKVAYPNYFTDIGQFVYKVGEYLDRR